MSRPESRTLRRVLARVSAVACLGSLAWLSPQVEVAYSYVPLTTDASLAVIRGGVGAEIGISISDTFSLFTLANTGGYYGLLRGSNAATGYGFAPRAAAGAQFLLSESIPIVVGAVTYGNGLFFAIALFTDQVMFAPWAP